MSPRTKAQGKRKATKLTAAEQGVVLDGSDDDEDAMNTMFWQQWVGQGLSALQDSQYAKRQAREQVKRAKEELQQAQQEVQQVREETQQALQQARDQALQARYSEEEAKRARDEAAGRVKELQDDLDKRLPTKCRCCGDYARLWCTLDPAPGMPAHGFCADCVPALVAQWHDPARWESHPQGACCVVPQCPHAANSMPRLETLLSKEAMAKYEAEKGAARQRAADKDAQRVRMQAQLSDALTDDLQSASAPSCPHCKRPGSVDNGCLCIRCPCGHEYCGWCFEFHRRTHPADTSVHDHVKTCRKNRVYNLDGTETYGNTHPELYRQHFEAMQNELLEKRKEEVRAILNRIGIFPMMPGV